MTYSLLPHRLVVDPVHRLPRLWSNEQIAAVGELFDGDVVNVSAWQDSDKNGRFYRSYFSRARSYTLTNFEADKRGFQGAAGEIFLDLEKPLQPELHKRFDAVFNHTTLEHVYEFRRAFANLCELSRDAVIIVVPWLQTAHSTYGDYWRFSPMAIARLFDENGLHTARLRWNGDKNASVYVFAIGVRDSAKWRGIFEFGHEPNEPRFFELGADCAGSQAVPAAPVMRLRQIIGRYMRRFSRPADTCAD